MNIYDYTIVCAIFFYPFKTQGRIILGRTVWSCCLTQGMESANNDARKWPILPDAYNTSEGVRQVNSVMIFVIVGLQ